MFMNFFNGVNPGSFSRPLHVCCWKFEKSTWSQWGGCPWPQAFSFTRPKQNQIPIPIGRFPFESFKLFRVWVARFFRFFWRVYITLNSLSKCGVPNEITGPRQTREIIYNIMQSWIVQSCARFLQNWKGSNCTYHGLLASAVGCVHEYTKESSLLSKLHPLDLLRCFAGAHWKQSNRWRLLSSGVCSKAASHASQQYKHLQKT